MESLEIVWLGIIAFCIVMYVILDGFTLGTGIVLPWLNSKERNVAMAVILPTWDGNQTWLVLGGACLYGAFPLAFATLFSGFYMPLIFMLIFLLFRGVVFEFRLKSTSGRKYWDRLFFFSSLLVAFIQGAILGSYIQGLDIPADTFVPFDWITPFSLMTGCAVIAGYTLLGSTRLVLKTEGAIRERMRMYAMIAGGMVALFMLAVSVLTPWVQPYVYHRWFDTLEVAFIMPFIAGVAFLMMWWSLSRGCDAVPYWCVVVIFLMGFGGLGYSVYPYLVPFHFTITQLASPPSTLEFIIVGAVIMIPVLLIYTGYSYRVFRGKVKEGESFEY